MSDSAVVSKVPSYRRHKPTGQAVVTLNGRDFYLGKHNTRASRAEYDRLIGEWLAAGRCLPGGANGTDLTVAELANAYLTFAKGYYRKNGELTGSYTRVKLAVRELRTSYGNTLVKQFGPLALQAIQKRLASSGRCRRYCNYLIDAIKRIFKWGVSQELLPETIYRALATVPGLKRGRTTAPESAPVRPVSGEVVGATLPHLPAVVADMVRLHRLIGARPNEVCIMRACDIDRSSAVWTFRPESHKTEHHGKERVIFIGPKAQFVLQPYLLRGETEYCFRPSESEGNRNSARREERQTPMTPSQAKRRRKRTPMRAAGDRYTTNSYRRAIERACELAFNMPESLRYVSKRFPKEERGPHLRAASQWRKENCWHPNRLRHSAATEIRRQFGLEAAQVVLGHAHAAISEVYAERDMALGVDVMAKVG